MQMIKRISAKAIFIVEAKINIWVIHFSTLEREKYIFLFAKLQHKAVYNLLFLHLHKYVIFTLPRQKIKQNFNEI